MCVIFEPEVIKQISCVYNKREVGRGRRRDKNITENSVGNPD